MAENKELIPKSELETLEKYNVALNKTTNELIALLPQFKAVSDELEKMPAHWKDMLNLINKQTAAEEKYKKVLSEKEKIEKKIADKEKELNALNSEQAKELERVNQQLIKQRQELRQEARESIAVAGSVEQLRATYNRLYTIWAQMDKAHPDFEKVGNEVRRLKTELDAAEQSTGDFRRNVGNYASGFSPLTYQIQQVARELPSLTMSTQQFFLAISNNLPMLVDEMNRVRAANKAMNEQGEKTVPVWKQMIKGILSWQTFLVVGITLLTAYGKEIGEFVKGLFAGGKASLSFSDAIKSANKALDTGDLGSQITNINKLSKAWAGLGDDAAAKKKFLVEYRDEIDQTGIAVNDINDAENLFVTNTDAYIAAIKLRAKAKAGEKLASEQYEKAVQAEIDNEAKLESLYARRQRMYDTIANYVKHAETLPADEAKSYLEMTDNFRNIIKDIDYNISLVKGEIESLNNAGDMYLGVAAKMSEAERQILNNANLNQNDDDAAIAEQEALKRLLELRSQAYEAERKATEDLNIFNIEQSAAANEAIIKDTEAGMDARLAALNRFVAAQKKSIEEAAEYQIDDVMRPYLEEGMNEEEARKLSAVRIQAIVAKKEAELTKITKEGAEIRNDIIQDEADRQIGEISKAAEKKAQAINEAEQEAVEYEFRRYQAGEISYEQFQQEKTKIAKEYELNRLQAVINTLEEQLTVEGLTEEEIADIKMALAKAVFNYDKYLSDQEIKMIEDRAKKEEAIEKQLADKKKELLRSVFDLAMTLRQARTESQLKELEEESERNEEHSEAEQERIDRLYEAGAISKEDADARKALVDQQEQDREKELEAQRAEIQKRQAQFEKAMSIAQIAKTLAEAIFEIKAQAAILAANPLTAALAAAALAQIPILVANAAVQTAMVLATPIPEYAEGTQDHRGGLAIVGDGGRPELVYANGAYWKTPSIPTLVNLPEHAQVFPDYEKVIASAEPPVLGRIPKDERIVVMNDGEAVRLLRQNAETLEKLVHTQEQLVASYNAERKEQRYRDFKAKAASKYSKK